MERRRLTMSRKSDVISAFRVESSLFFVTFEGELKQVVFIEVGSNREISKAQLILTGDNQKIVRNVDKINKGKTILEMYVPEAKAETTYNAMLRWDDNKVESTVTVTPQKHWVVHIIHHSHLDIGYTDPQVEVLDHHLNYLDQVLELCDLQNDDPETNFKWVVEATWPLKYWLQSRPSKQVKKMIQRIKEGRIEVCADYMNMHTEAYDIDELARSFEMAQMLRDKYQIEICTAMQSDVPGLTKGFLTCLTDMGIKYLSVAHNYAGRAIPYLLPGPKLRRPFYWKLDRENEKKVLVWYTDTPHGVYMEGNLLGLSKSYEEVFEKLPSLLKEMQDGNYEFSDVHVRVQGAFWDNAGPSIVPSQIAKTWNDKWAYPKLITSTNKQFFEKIESDKYASIPEFCGDWTDWWSDGIASNAYTMGLNRKTHQLLRSVQTLHSILNFGNKKHIYPKEELDRVYEKMTLFDEHTWGAWNPWESSLKHNTSGEIQWSIKRNFAQSAYDESLFEYRKVLNLLPEILRTRYDKESISIIIYNSSSFNRTDVVDVFIPFGKCDVRKGLKILNENGEEVRYSLKLHTGELPEPVGATVTFIAKNVPPFGQVRYQVLTEEKEVRSRISINQNEDTVIENSFYRIIFDPDTGGILSIMDKEISQELVNPKAVFLFNEYVYDQFTTAPRFNHLSSRIVGNPQTLLGRRSSASLLKRGKEGKASRTSMSEIKLVEKNNVYQKMLVTLHLPGCEWIEQEIILYDEIKRMDIVNRLMKIETEAKEAVYFSFPFNIENGRTWYEINGGYISPDDEFVPGSCHYLRAIQNWVAMSNSQYTILWGTLEAPLVQFQNIHVPYNPFDKTLEADEPCTVYSYVMNNIWDTNFPNRQGGEVEFHYSITSHANGFDPLTANRFGEEVQNALMGVTVPYHIDDKCSSFISTNAENVKILGVRKLDKNKYQIRVQEVGCTDTDVELVISNACVREAFVSNVGNGNLKRIRNEANKINFEIGKREIKTIVFTV
ncbi:MAG TPA: glycoside hydrolase family 38 C-terminal domain-containing protein [Fervidobacterium sp.]|nr:glycoside hydrolase family 38 C-terminal domain-containing protein [Fervidobacterium sp.]